MTDDGSRPQGSPTGADGELEDERDAASATDEPDGARVAIASPGGAARDFVSPAKADAGERADPASNDALVERLWARVLEAWDDDKPHQAILEHALRTESLPTLAGLYRSLTSDPEKEPRAKKKLDGIVAAATQMLFATKSPVRTKTPWQWTASVAVVCLFVLAWLSYRIIVHR